MFQRMLRISGDFWGLFGGLGVFGSFWGVWGVFGSFWELWEILRFWLRGLVTTGEGGGLKATWDEGISSVGLEDGLPAQRRRKGKAAVRQSLGTSGNGLEQEGAELFPRWASAPRWDLGLRVEAGGACVY